ncbi:MAG: F0F1 ATP synthase subunit delta [Micavibrio sp.]|nr:F0F1 ATP synthase subunit delta [Micavibrio sp.]
MSCPDNYAKSTANKNIQIIRIIVLSAAIRVSSVVTSRYATALLDLAADKKKVEKVEADMKDLGAMLDASSELRDLVHDPRISKSTQKKVIADVVKKAKFQDITNNFLNVLIENRRLNILEAVIKRVHQELAAMRGERIAKIKVAQDLTQKQIKELEASLAKASGSTVTLDIQVDPALLGGMVITLDSRMIDDSVAGKLERLKLAMSRGSNENQVKNLSEVV